MPSSIPRAWAVALGLFAAPAQAQQLPDWLVAGALSPVLALLLAIALGYLARRWSTGAWHAGLILLWIALFWVASVYVTNDYIIWTPLAAYIGHLLVMLGLVIRRLFWAR